MDEDWTRNGAKVGTWTRRVNTFLEPKGSDLNLRETPETEEGSKDQEGRVGMGALVGLV